jgi:GDP-mannose 6-dehydrogenase
MQISVFGLGYVGCVTAACLARVGHVVTAVDVNDTKVAMVNARTSPIVEPELGEVLVEVVAAGRLRATTSATEAIEHSDIALICVGTPSRPNGALDDGALRRVTEQIGRALSAKPKAYTIVLRSTVLAGTTDRVLVPALRAAGAPGLGDIVGVAVNPEFMREGSSLQDFMAPPFTLVGCQDERSRAQLRSLYEWLDAPFVATSIETAETVKYACNAFHALKISFANEIADICTALGADPHEVMRVFKMDRVLNISEAYLRPGFAFGGSCLPKDLRALLHAARDSDLQLPLLSAILPSNELQIRRAVQTVLDTRKRRVGIVGLAFKPGTDDLRESPMVTLVEALIGKGCDIRILDRDVSIARLANTLTRRFRTSPR